MRAPPEAQAASPSARHGRHYSSRLSERVIFRNERRQSRKRARRASACFLARGEHPPRERPPDPQAPAPGEIRREKRGARPHAGPPSRTTAADARPPRSPRTAAAGARPPRGPSAARSPSTCRSPRWRLRGSRWRGIEGGRAHSFRVFGHLRRNSEALGAPERSGRAFSQVTRIPTVTARAFCLLRPLQTSEFRRKCPFFADFPARRPPLPPDPPPVASQPGPSPRRCPQGAVAAPLPGGAEPTSSPARGHLPLGVRPAPAASASVRPAGAYPLGDPPAASAGASPRTFRLSRR